MKPLIAFTLIVVATLAMGYCSWRIYRSVNYTFGYEDMVRGTICEAVRPEALQPGACE